MRGARTRLVFVLLVGLALRLWGIGFGLPYIIARPDETEIAGPAVGFLSGDLRPPFFEWPTLFVYTVALLYFCYYGVTRPFSPYKTLAAFAESRRQSVAPFLYISRLLSAAMGVVTIWGVHALCKRLFDEVVALVAALFLALCFLHVRDSHFGTTDVAMTALVALTVLAILRWRELGTLRLACAAGFVGGLASSTKYNGLGVVVPFGVAAIERLIAEAKTGTTAKASREVIAGSCAFAAALALGFLGTSPFILIDWQRFVASVSGVESHLAQGHGVILGRGWWYYATVVLPAAVGWPMLAAAGAGSIGLMWRQTRDALVLFAFPIAYYLFAGRSFTVFARYMIPVLPFICIAAAWAVVEGCRAVTRLSNPVLANALMTAAVIGVAAPTAAKSVALDRLLSTTDNRIVVADSLRELIPPAAFVYQSGERYGYIPMMMEGKQIARSARYDEQSGLDPALPDWILLQRSPLVLYSTIPPSIVPLLAGQYYLVRSYPAGRDDPDRIYDQQDAFFLPLTHLAGIVRPGPAFELYRRRSDR